MKDAIYLNNKRKSSKIVLDKNSKSSCMVTFEIPLTYKGELKLLYRAKNYEDQKLAILNIK